MQPDFVTVKAVPAKSAAHRALFCGSMARGKSLLSPACICADTSASIRCLEGAGFGRIESAGSAWHVTGGPFPASGVPLDAGESGTTLRFLVPLLLDGDTHFIHGGGRLLSRPLSLYERYCQEWDISSGLLRFRGRLESGRHLLPGNVSSQYVSALMMALARLEGDSTVIITPPVESRGYISLTARAMNAFGVRVEENGEGSFSIPGRQQYSPCDYKIEGDWSYAAALLAIGCNANGIAVSGLDPQSLQPDSSIYSILQEMNAPVRWRNDLLTVQGSLLNGCCVDIAQTPDLAPVLAALFCTSAGTSRIVNASRLRLKESDRLHALAVMLRAIGADITETEDSLAIIGRVRLDGGSADASGDHRIAMAAAVAALKCREPVRLTGSDSVHKSAPGFWQVYEAAGGAGHVIRMGQET